ncbi:MAG: hypothetical protein EZS28_020999 [Streblomastix strix]|uniref:Uncharacterized protein n=1 Tax=Streblomastix strix TaxID=222440 RepID=A0A5J4VM09_9EUKA|nr:MAG: hypothetical protein EZS28_020999 [Streblomastix strix]
MVIINEKIKQTIEKAITMQVRKQNEQKVVIISIKMEQETIQEQIIDQQKKNVIMNEEDSIQQIYEQIKKKKEEVFQMIMKMQKMEIRNVIEPQRCKNREEQGIEFDLSEESNDNEEDK